MGDPERSHHHRTRLPVEHAALVDTRRHCYVRRCRLCHAQGRPLALPGKVCFKDHGTWSFQSYGPRLFLAHIPVERICRPHVRLRDATTMPERPGWAQTGRYRNGSLRAIRSDSGRSIAPRRTAKFDPFRSFSVTRCLTQVDPIRTSARVVGFQILTRAPSAAKAAITKAEGAKVSI